MKIHAGWFIPILISLSCHLPGNNQETSEVAANYFPGLTDSFRVKVLYEEVSREPFVLKELILGILIGPGGSPEYL